MTKLNNIIHVLISGAPKAFVGESPDPSLVQVLMLCYAYRMSYSSVAPRAALATFSPKAKSINGAPPMGC